MSARRSCRVRSLRKRCSQRKARLTTYDYSAMRVISQHGIARVTLDNAPVNVLSLTLMTELTDFLRVAADDAAIKVIIFDSADPEFFIAHVDMTIAEVPNALTKLQEISKPGLNPFQSLSEALRHQPQVTIVKLAGMARGGGAEFVAAADMSFGAIGLAKLAHCEALMGIVPGGGGTQYLSYRMGRSRALEAILGAGLFDAETAAQYGWINRALPAEQLDSFVDRLAAEIAALPEGVIRAAKHAVTPADFYDGLQRENDAWASLVFQPNVVTLDGWSACARCADA